MGRTVLLALLTYAVIPSVQAATPSEEAEEAVQQAAYVEAIRAQVLAQWVKPYTVHRGQLCPVMIHQAPGGHVIQFKVEAPCEFEAEGMNSLERAVLASSPLPYYGFEQVFSPRIRLRFLAE